MVPSGTLPNMAMEIVTGPGVRSVSPPNSGQPNMPASSRRPSAKAAKPIVADLLRQRQRQQETERARALGGEIGQIHPQRLARHVACRVVGKEMHAADDGVGLEHQVAARRRLDEGGIVGKAERARMGRDRLEIARDQTVFGRTIVMRAAMASPGEFGRAQFARQLIEHGIDHAGLVALDESGGDIGIFRHHDARRHVAAVVELVGACA